MLKLALPALSFVIMSFPAASTWAQCVTIDPVIVPQIRVDPLDAGGSRDLVQPFELSIRRAGVGSNPITLHYQIVDEDSSAIARVGLSQGPVVQWSSSDSSREIGALRYESYALLRSGYVALDEAEVVTRKTVTLRLNDVRTDIPAGIYREQFSVRYWCESDETGIPYEAPGAVAVSVAVPNVLSATVAGTSLRGEIDFMDFSTLVRSLQVNVRSTGPYKVTARSVNGSTLLREGSSNAQDPADRISYSADFSGEPLDFGGGKPPEMMPRAGLVGQIIPLTVRVDSIAEKAAGLFSDTIFLTLEPAN